MDTPHSSETKQDELLRALQLGDVELFKRLLDDTEVRADFQYYKKGSCLEIACRDIIPHCDEIITLLLQRVKPNVHSLKPQPIHFAAESGNVTAMKLLLRHRRTKINVVTSEGLTPLHFAARNFNKNPEKYGQILELLLRCKTLDINRPNENGCTALHEAVHAGCRGAVLKMLELRPVGFDLDTHRCHGHSARDEILHKFPDVEPLLPEFKVTIEEAPEEQVRILNELLNRNIDSFKRLLQQVDDEGIPVVDPNYSYDKPHSTTCLNEACKEKNLNEFVHALLEAGADPNLVNTTTRRAPIHVAISFSNFEAVETLLYEEKIDANVRDKDGNTPLHYIVNYVEDDEQALQLIDKLLNLEADLELTNQNDETALKGAIKKKRTDEFLNALRKMEEKHKDEQPESIKLRLFHSLYGRDNESFLNILNTVKDKALLDISHNCSTLLQTACMYNMEEAVQTLLILGADPNLTTPQNVVPPLFISARDKRFEILEKFLECGSRLKINIADDMGDTALHIVAQSRNLWMVVKLVQAGADMAVKNNLGKEPISSSLLKELLDKGLITNQVTPPGEEKLVIFDYEFLIGRKTKTETQQSVTSNEKDEETACMCTCPGRVSAEPEMNNLSYIINSCSENTIINHPIVSSFMALKWSRLKYLCYANFLFMLLFTIFLILYIGRGCYIETRCSLTETVILRAIIGLLLFVLVLRELVQVLSSFTAYTRNPNNLLDLLMILSTVLTVFIPFSHTDAKLFFVVLSVLSSTINLMLVSGRFKRISQYVSILKKVTQSFLYMVAVYSILLLSFSICFYVLFRDTKNQDFPNFFVALFKVIMMMSGDLNTEELQQSSSSPMGYLTYTAFGLIVVILLLNLLTGLAVSDIREIREAASLLSLRSQVNTMKETELAVISLYRWAPILSRLYSVDNFMVGALIDHYTYLLPYRGAELINGNERVKMDQEWLYQTLTIISQRSVADKSLSVGEQLSKIQDTLQKMIDRIDATGRETVTGDKT